MQKKLVIVASWISYLFFLGVWLFCYLFFREYVFLGLAAGMLLMCPIGILSVFYLRKRVSLSLCFDKRQVGKDTLFFARLSLENPTFWVSRNVSVKLEIENRFLGEKRIHYVLVPVRPKKTTTVTLNLEGNRCGMVVCRVLECEIDDWFGLVICNRKWNLSDRIAILPNLTHLEISPQHLQRGSATDESENELLNRGEQSDYDGLREYQSGDRLQNIHWKLSSAADQFRVKQFVGGMSRKITLLLNMQKGITDDTVELYFSLAVSLTKNGIGFYLCYPNRNGFEEVWVENREQVRAAVSSVYEQPLSENECILGFERLFPQKEGVTLAVSEKNQLPMELRNPQNVEISEKGAVAVWL